MKKTMLLTMGMLLGAMLLTGCAAQSVDTDMLTSSASGDTASAVQMSYTAEMAEASSELFTSRDLTQTADLSDAQYLTAASGETLTITQEGVYVLSGSATDCTILVNAEDSAKVQLVLDRVSITNADFPVIYVVSADKVFVTTTDSENTLSVTGSYVSDGDTNTDAVIFSKEDLTLNGTGTLSVTSAAGNGITSKDDLKITGGTYTITGALDALEANDNLLIADGSFTIRTDKDGLHSENDEDLTQGAVVIEGGTFDITAGSDGIQGTTTVTINGGTLDIQAAEGIEATQVIINDGTISIEATDDGINATANANLSVSVTFNGGDTTIVMAQGDTDAVDANGSIYVNDGTINITAPCVSFDYDQTAEYNGGTIIINGQQVDSIPAEMMGGGMMGGQGGFGSQMGGGHMGVRGGRMM